MTSLSAITDRLPPLVGMLRGPSSIKSSPSTNLSAAASTPSEPRHLVPRLLFPHLDARQSIPQIWKGDSLEIRQLNDEMYLFIALALRAFVQPWYTKITPRDRTLLPRITAILVHLIQTLTQRIIPQTSLPPRSSSSSSSNVPPPSTSPLTPFILLHLPLILTHHIRTYHTAASLPVPRPASTVATFEALQPHVGVLSPGGGGIDPLYLGQVVEGLMKVGLEEEDYESELERGIVRELVARLVVGGVLRKVGEGWFWWGIGLGVFGIKREREEDKRDEADDGVEELLQEKEIPLSPLPPPPPRSPPPSPASHSRFSPTPHILTLLNLLQTLLTLSILLVSHLSHVLALLRSSPPVPPYPYVLEPWIDLFSEILQLESSHRASFTGRVLWWWVRGMGRTIGWIGGDRLIPHLLETAVLTPKTATLAIKKLRTIMFPQGYPVPSPPDPTPEEASAMREQLEGLLNRSIKGPLRPLLLSSPSSTPSSQAETISGILDPFADSQMHAHLLINMLDAVVGVVLPELVLGRGEPALGGGLGEAQREIEG